MLSQTPGFPFSILVPVYNETNALSFSMHYMREAGLSPIYVVDRKRPAATEALIAQAGVPRVFFDNDKPFIENGYESFVAQSPTDWVLRLDCDEVPNLDLLAYCRDFVEQQREGVAGFERHQLLWKGDRFLTATTDRFSPPHQRQWRLFNRRTVQFNQQIHTAGIHLPTLAFAPPQAEIYHLSWVFLTWQNRLAKAARYDDHGQPAVNRANQLFPLEEVSWQELDRPFLRDCYAEWALATGNSPA